MGDYVYVIHKSNPIKATLSNGVKILVHRLKYLYKPYSSLFMFPGEKDPNARWERIASRIMTAWGDQRPDYCVHCDDDGTPYEPAAVFKNPPSPYLNDGSKVYADMVKNNKIGNLVQDGHGWRVEEVPSPAVPAVKETI